VNISSIDKDYYPAQEIQKVLTVTEELKAEFSLRWSGEKDEIAYRRVMETMESLQEALTVHYKEFHAMECALVAAASSRMKEKQRVLLRWLAKNRNEKAVYTVLIGHLSESLDIPKSTVRWNLRRLREAGLIRAGDRDNKGIPVDLTEMGSLIAEYLSTSQPDTEHI